MEIGMLYQFVLVLVLIAIVGALGIVILGNLKGNSAISSDKTATQAIGNASSGIGTIFTTWYGIVILVAMAALIIVLLVRSFNPLGARSR